MSSPPDNMKLEGLIEDNWDEDAVTPVIVAVLEPYREQIEDIAARFDAAEQSWRDYRIAVWSPVPENVMNHVRVAWVKAIDEKKSAGQWVRRDDEPDIDSAEGVDLLVADRYDMADLSHAGLVITGHEKTDRGLIAHVRFPPNCARYRFIVGRGISVQIPRGVVTIEGSCEPWKIRLVQRPPVGIEEALRQVPLADLAKEIMSRGAFVVFDEPLDAEISKLVCAVLRRFCGPDERHEQPAPVPNGGAVIWELVIADTQRKLSPGQTRDGLIADMRDRDRLGRERYGTPLQANNGRDALLDAYQEALDGTAYARQKCEEDPDLRSAHIVYNDFLEIAYRLRYILGRREK